MLMKHALFLLALASAAASLAAQTPAQRLPDPQQPGRAISVRVADAPLVFTGLVVSTDVRADAAAQASAALAALRVKLKAAGSELSQVARLNVYLADDAALPGVEQVVATQFRDTPVAVSLVRSPLPLAGARVGLEAVAVSSRSPGAVEVIDDSAAILPAGGKIFISGQAERGADLATANKLTMAGLHRSVAHLGLKKSDIVQVKAFVRPFEDHAAAQREIAASFDGGPVPPVVLVEWISTLFTEIEIVVSARSLDAAQTREPISHSWLPWLTKSPRYCHIAHVGAGTPLIFLGAIEGGSGDARTQMKTIFERLGSTLFEAGSSYRNLAKATYYLVDPAAQALLGDIRAVYYDPTRPPAASAIRIGSLGVSGRAAAVDMIAVPLK